MRMAPLSLPRWLPASLLPLLAACGPTDPSDALAELLEPQQGLITFYEEADGSGNCSFDPGPDRDIAAMNIGQYLDSAICGACAQVTGPKGSLVVRIVDSCPDCPDAGHLDLSPEAFAKLANREEGRVKVTWQLVPCPTQGVVRYHYKDGSNPYWTAIQVRNHRQPVTKLEYWKDGAWVNVPRESYNYFVNPQGMGTSPFKVRVTASDGQTLEDSLPAVASDQTFDGAAQFK